MGMEQLVTALEWGDIESAYAASWEVVVLWTEKGSVPASCVMYLSSVYQKCLEKRKKKGPPAMSAACQTDKSSAGIRNTNIKRWLRVLHGFYALLQQDMLLLGRVSVCYEVSWLAAWYVSGNTHDAVVVLRKQSQAYAGSYKL